jgi:NDP-sugar pyrophosphorylase family protein
VKFFILAGGYGRRAEPLSRVKPKPAFPLAGVPLIARMLDQLRGLGCAQGFVNLHHLGEQVAAAAGEAGIRFIAETELTGSRVLRRALPFFTDWLLAVNGDTFLEIPLARMAAKAADPGIDGVLLSRQDGSGRYARLRCDGDDFLESAPPVPGTAGPMYAGVALLRRRAVEAIDEANFFASIRKRGLRFRTVPYDGIWLDIGTPASYFQANWEYMSHAGENSANALSPGVAFSPGARVERSVLWQGTTVGPGVRLSECVVTGDMELRHVRHAGKIVSRLGVFPLF